MKPKKQPAALNPSCRLDLASLLPAMGKQKGWPAAKVAKLATMLGELLEPPHPGEVYPNERLRTPDEAANTAIPRALSDNRHGVTPGNAPEHIQMRAKARRFIGELYASARRQTAVPLPEHSGKNGLRTEALLPFGWEWEKAFRRGLEFFEKSTGANHFGAFEIVSMLTVRDQDFAEHGIARLGDLVETREADFTNRQIGEIVTRAWLSDDHPLFAELANMSKAKARTGSDSKMPALPQGVELICIALNLCLTLNRNPTRKELKAQCVKEGLSVPSWRATLANNDLDFLASNAGRPKKLMS